MRVTSLLIGAVVLLFTTSTAVAQVVDEQAGTDLAAGVDTSGRIGIGDTALGRIPGSADADWYAVSLTEGQTINATLTGDDGDHPLPDSFLEIRDASGTALAQNDDSDGLNAGLTFTAPQTATYYLVARPWYGWGGYRLSVTAGEASSAPNRRQAGAQRPPIAGSLEGRWRLHLVDDKCDARFAAIENREGRVAAMAQCMITVSNDRREMLPVVILVDGQQLHATVSLMGSLAGRDCHGYFVDNQSARGTCELVIPGSRRFDGSFLAERALVD